MPEHPEKAGRHKPCEEGRKDLLDERLLKHATEKSKLTAGRRKNAKGGRSKVDGRRSTAIETRLVILSEATGPR